MFIPLYDGNPLGNIKFPWVNYTVIITNIVIFIFVLQPYGVGKIAFSLGLIPSVVNDFRDLPSSAVWIQEEATYITYAFLHGDWLHLIGNMIFLWVFGDNIEDAMGHIKYLVFYLLCAVAAGLAHSFYFGPSETPLVGASGAVAGVVAAYLILHPRVKVWILIFMRIPLPLSAMWCLGAWVTWQVFQFVTNHESQTSWISHIGGIVAGGLLIIVFKYRHVPLFDRA